MADALSIPLAILVGLLASCIQSLGLTIQRKSHVQNQALPEHLQKVEHRRPLWLLGFAVFISSNVLGSLIQIASLPVVILAPLGAVSLLWNAFFARIILGDVFSPWMVLGTLFIASGAVLIAVFGVVPEPTHSLEDLLVLFSRPAFVAYFSILGTLVIICLVITHVSEYSLSRRYSDLTCPSPPISIEAPLDSSASTSTLPENMADERTPLLAFKPTTALSSSPSLSDQLSNTSTSNKVFVVQDENKYLLERNESVRARLLLSISYASFSGILSGMCLLFAKSGVELLVLTIRGNNQFWRWQAWVLVLGLVMFALLQLWYLHKALVLAGPTLVCPSAFCFYNLSSIVNGLVYFDQFSLIPRPHLFLVILGIIVLLGGVWIVSIQSEGGQEDVWADDNGRLESDEEAVGDGTLNGLNDRKESSRGKHSRIEPMLADQVIQLEPDNAPSNPASMKAGKQQLVTLRQGSGSPSVTSSSRRAVSYTHSFSSRHADPMYTEATYTQQRIRALQQPHRASTSSNIQLTTAPAPGNHPLNGAVPTFGTGFQIGLSPLSPGFEIVPRGKRRQSALSGAEHQLLIDDERQDGRRRAFSEGRMQRVVVSDELSPIEDEVVGRSDGEEDCEDRVVGKGKGTGDKFRHGGSRWNWLKRTFGRKE
ncbi:hypothetical protein AX17_000194 [Amanita inopinata Kibby_2008]|nr:hypothetical protein AX17_000194 [Amanita inopinata Kibby_2008]